ncbi:MAG: hypothetical protein KBT36_01790 [Kurthia sp.]|nr:hypothetical protein [Candidatus Kurthia equi]
MEQLDNQQSERAVATFSKATTEQKLANERTKQLLLEAKKLHLQQQTLKLEQIYKQGRHKEATDLAYQVLQTYKDNPIIGELTDKVVYIQHKATEK